MSQPGIAGARLRRARGAAMQEAGTRGGRPRRRKRRITGRSPYQTLSVRAGGQGRGRSGPLGKGPLGRYSAVRAQIAGILPSRAPNSAHLAASARLEASCAVACVPLRLLAGRARLVVSRVVAGVVRGCRRRALRIAVWGVAWLDRWARLRAWVALRLRAWVVLPSELRRFQRPFSSWRSGPASVTAARTE